MSNETSPGSAIDQLIGQLPRHTFTIPDGPIDPKNPAGPQYAIRELSTDPTTITIRQLTFAEERQALDAAEANSSSFPYEGAMRALVAADGKELTWTDNQKDRFFTGLSNKVRDLVIRAFIKVCLPQPKETEDFLASEKVTIK